jgi:hypothetical protein
MPHARGAWVIAALAVGAILLTAGLGTAAPRPARVGPPAVFVPYLRGAAPLCHLDTAHFRLWWSERRGAAAAVPDADGSCATHPALVTTLLGTMEGIRGAEHRLGFPPAPNDAGLPGNGGNGHYDVFVDGRGNLGTGYGECGLDHGRWVAYMEMGARPFGIPARLAVNTARRTFAHEYFHGVQCAMGALVPGLSNLIVQGTAEWMVPVIAGPSLGDEAQIFQGTATLIGTVEALHEVGGHQGSLIASSARGDHFVSYRYWGFWYGATDGRAWPGLIRRLLARIASHPARILRDHGISDLYTVLGPARVRAGLLALAVHGRAGGRFGQVPLPSVGWEGSIAPDPATKIAIPSGGGQTGTAVGVPGGLGYRYVRVRWPAALDRVRFLVHAVGRPPGALAGSIALIHADGSVSLNPARTPQGLLWEVHTGGNAGSATVVMTNPARAALRVALVASSP